MDDLRDLPQHRVGELVAAQERLEAAVAAVVGELDAAHVERRRVGRHLVGVVDEHELGVRVDEAADQPGAGGAVDVAVTARRPPHRDRLLDAAQPARRAAAARARARAAGSSRGRGSGAARAAAARERASFGSPAASTCAPRPGPLVLGGDRLGHARGELALLRRRRRARDPDRRLAARLHDLVREPLELLALPGVERQRDQPVDDLRAPSRRSLRQSAIRGVDGSRGRRYASSTH